MSLDYVLLTTSDRVADGLHDMMESAVGSHDLVHKYVDASTALLIIEAAKRAEDRAEWFPHGKWATIQAMQGATEKQLARMFETVLEPKP